MIEVGGTVFAWGVDKDRAVVDVPLGACRGDLGVLPQHGRQLQGFEVMFEQDGALTGTHAAPPVD